MELQFRISFLLLAIFLLKICDANQPPYFTADGNNLVIPENSPVGSPIFNLRAIDPEGSQLRYGIMGTDKLVVDEYTGVISIVKPIDREIMSKLKLTVTVEDVVENGENNLVTIPITFTIDDRNDNYPQFQNQSSYESLEVMEDTRVGSIILSITVRDPDLTGFALSLNCTPSTVSREACDMFQLDVKESSASLLRANLKLANKLDYNKRSLYQFTLTSSDGEHRSVAGVMIRVKDIQNSPPAFVGSMSGRISEDAPVGSLIMVIEAKDGDNGRPRDVKLSLLSNPGDAFQLDSRTGHLTTIRPLDREILGSVVTLEVRATEIPRNEELTGTIRPDVDQLQTQTNVTILIDDENDESPQFNSKEFWTEINENTPAGTPLPLLDILVTDNDSGTYADFTLRIEGPLSDLFDIEPKFATGSARPVIRLKKSFDYENPNERKFLILIVAQNVQEPFPFSTSTITLTIVDENDNRPQFERDVYSLQVPESTKAGVKIGSITANDPDSKEFGNEGLVYTLVGSGNKKFSVNPKTGDIFVAQCNSSSSSNTTILGNNCLDYETQKTYDLLYMASDNFKKEGFIHSIVPLQIVLLDENDNVPFFTEKFSRIILENSQQFDPRFFIKAQDIDKSAVLAYDFVPPAPQHFIIDENSAELLIRGPSLPPGNYSFIVQVTDGLFKTEAPVQINVTDINNHAPVFDEKTKRSITIPEDADVGSILTRLSASDEDLNLNGKVRYSLDKGSYGFFEINKRSGEITLVKELDFSKRPKFALLVSAYDAGQPIQWTSTTLHVTVANVYKPLPKITPQIQRAQVSESSAVGELVTQISINSEELGLTSEDLADLSFQFVLPVEAKNSDNKPMMDLRLIQTWFSIDDEGKVRIGSELKREIATNINLTVMITSENSKPALQHFGSLLINIYEVNDLPPRLEDMEIETYEELPPGMAILTLEAEDPEGGQISNYFIQKGSDLLSVDNKTGEIKVKGRLDFETKPVYNVTVVAVDSGDPQLSSTATIMISLVNINDNSPQFNQSVYETSIDEHSPEGTKVLSVFATDADGDVIHYSIESNSKYSSAFKIDRLGDITVSKDGPVLLDRENLDDLNYSSAENGWVSINVKAKDTHRTGYATVRVKLNDINDIPIKFDAKNYQTALHAPLRSSQDIIKLNANSGDLAETNQIRYKIVSGNEGGIFEIDRKSGVLRAARAHDRAGEFRLVVEVIDNDGDEKHDPDDEITKSEHSDRAGVFIEILPGNFKKPEFLFPNKINSTLIAQESDDDEIHLFQSEYTKVLGQLMAFDPDEGEAGEISYYFKHGDNLVTETDEFRVETKSGKIHQIKALDREEINQYNLVVVAKDNGNPVSTQSDQMLTILIDDIDDFKPVFLKRSYSFTIKENTLENTFIGQVHAIDNDEGRNAQIFYFLSSDESHRYQNRDTRVDIKTGMIHSNAVLDRERIESYQLFVRASPSPLFNRSLEIVTLAEATEDPSVTIVNISVLDENDESPKFSQKMYYAGINSEAEPGREILTLKAIDVDPSSSNSIQYSLLGANLILDDFKSGGSVIPSPFRVENLSGRLTLSSVAMRQYGGGNNRFMVKVGVKETIPPYHQDTTQVQVWVVENSQEVILTVKSPPAKMLKDVLVDVLANVTGYLVLVNKVTPHVAEDESINKGWSDVYVTPVDKKSSSIIPVGQFLQALDLGHDKLKQNDCPIELYAAVPAVGAGSPEGGGFGEYFFNTRESFDSAFAGLVALIALLCLGVAAILALCCCLNKMHHSEKEAHLSPMKFPLHPGSGQLTPAMASRTNLMIGPPDMMEDHLATDNPLWIDHKIKNYEEQELTMQVVSDADNSNTDTDNMSEIGPRHGQGQSQGQGQGQSLNHGHGHGQILNNRPPSPQSTFSHAYATLHQAPEYEKFDQDMRFDLMMNGEEDTLAVHL